jgi:hypothetical protein
MGPVYAIIVTSFCSWRLHQFIISSSLLALLTVRLTLPPPPSHHARPNDFYNSIRALTHQSPRSSQSPSPPPSGRDPLTLPVLHLTCARTARSSRLRLFFLCAPCWACQGRRNRWPVISSIMYSSPTRWCIMCLVVQLRCSRPNGARHPFSRRAADWMAGAHDAATAHNARPPPPPTRDLLSWHLLP